MPTLPRTGEIGALTGLRGIAALLVTIGHFAHFTAVTPWAAVPASVGLWAGAMPGIGMSIFFTLSGFVIALSYSDWNWRARPVFNLVRFFIYRFARLYPAFFVFAILILLRSTALQDLSDPQVQAYLAPHLLLLQSWLPTKYGGVDASTDLFHVSWSISTECGLYLMFGLAAVAVAAVPTWRHKASVLTVALSCAVFVLLLLAWLLRRHLAPADWTDAEWYGWLFYLAPWGIAAQFGIGVLAYRTSCLTLPEKFARIASNLGAVGIITVYLFCVVGIIRAQVPQAILMSLSTALLMIGSLSSSVTNRLLTRPGLLYVGMISYSLYLFHFAVPPIAFHGQFQTFNFSAGVYYAANFAFSLALAIMLATGVYRLVEVPGRRILRRAGDRLLGIRRPLPAASGRSAAAE